MKSCKEGYLGRYTVRKVTAGMRKLMMSCLFLVAGTVTGLSAQAGEGAEYKAPAAVRNEEGFTGRDIAVMVNEADSSQDMCRNAVMVIERGGQKLLRKMEMRTLRVGDERRSLIRFSAPPDIQDSQFLSWTHDDIRRGDDLWVFLPSENMVRRISGGGKKNAFMRSSFALEDIEYRSVDADEHRFLRNDKLNSRDVWVIESAAVKEKSGETGYGRRVIFVDKEYRLPSRIEYYDTRNRLIKTMMAGDFRKISGIWSAGKMIMQEEGRDSRTLLQYTDVVYNRGLDPAIFDHSSLKR